MKRIILSLLVFSLASATALAQTTAGSETGSKTLSNLTIKPAVTNPNIPAVDQKMLEIFSRLKSLETENSLLKERLQVFEFKYANHRHLVGGFVGTGFMMAKLNEGNMVAVPFALNGEEMKRNKNTGLPINE